MCACSRVLVILLDIVIIRAMIMRGNLVTLAEVTSNSLVVRAGNQGEKWSES